MVRNSLNGLAPLFDFGPHRRQMMLAAFDLARRTEAGEHTPSHVVEHCTTVIVAREADIGAFVTLASKGAPGCQSLGSTGASTFNRLWTLMGPPCVNVPGLVDPKGPPLAIQFIGRFGADLAALEASRFVEFALCRNPVGSR